jgi:hypothetical protein
MTHSVGYGQGDSAFYVGGTPPQKHPQTTVLEHLLAYKNVFGFSGSNSKYMVMRNSEFYDNGVGLIPNTWKPEPYQPASDGVIEHNLIYWNNFDYFRPGSPCCSESADGRSRAIRSSAPSCGARRPSRIRPTTRARRSTTTTGSPTTRWARPSTMPTEPISLTTAPAQARASRPNGAATVAASSTDASLYPTCPSTAGSGTVTGDANQARKLLAIADANPPTDQERFWHVHPHPPRKGRKPYEG